MTAHSFDFTLNGDDRCWAASYTPGMVSLVLNIAGYRVGITLAMTPADAHAMADAIHSAATHAENALPSGLGKSEAA